MELGPIFAILAAVFFAVTHILIRRATHQSDEAFTAMAISLLVGTPIFIFILSITDEWQYLWSFSCRQYVLLGTAGVIQFIITRYLVFNCIRIIGSNRTMAIIRIDVIFAIVFGVVLLGESVTVQQIGGALLILCGSVLSSIELSRNTLKIETRGLLMGLGAALCFAGSAALIRPVMVTTDAVYAATFVSYLTAFIILLGILLLRKQQRNQILRQSRYNLIILTFTAIFMVIGQLLRFSALKYSPVSVVTPLLATVVIFTLILSWIVNRKIDVFNRRVIAGIVLVLAGVFLIY